MKFFLLSKTGDGLPLLKRIEEEGNDVQFYLFDDFCRTKKLYKEILQAVGSVKEGLNNDPDVIFFDMVGNGELADDLKEQGYNVFGASKFADDLELDRKFGMQICADYDIAIPETLVFESITDVGNFLKKDESGNRWVFKPCGNLPTDWTYVSKSNEDLLSEVEGLEHEKEIHKAEAFLLQKYIKGIEISTELFLSEGVPIYPANNTIEIKKFLAGDYGSNTGCMSSVVWACNDIKTRLVEKTLAKLLDRLLQEKYTGPLDVNSIISEDNFEPYALEWTCRFGYNAIFCLCELLNEPLGQLIYDVAVGNKRNIDLRDGFAYGIRISVPPYPHIPEEKRLKEQVMETATNVRIGIDRLTDEDKQHIWLEDVKMLDNKLVSAGADAVVIEVTDYANTIEETETKVKNILDKLEINNLQCRVYDGAERAKKQIPILTSWGYFDMKKEKQVELSVPLESEILEGIKEIANIDKKGRIVGAIENVSQDKVRDISKKLFLLKLKHKIIQSNDSNYDVIYYKNDDPQTQKAIFLYSRYAQTGGKFDSLTSNEHRELGQYFGIPQKDIEIFISTQGKKTKPLTRNI